MARTALHLLHGVAIVITRWQRLDTVQRHRLVAWWAGKQLRLLGVQLMPRGQFRPGASMLLANHVSWLDILAIHAVCPRVRFVSRADVRHWPLVGHLTLAAGSLFIERARKRDALRVVHQIAAALEAGDTVAVFPEGTTGDGQRLLPFHANLLEAAITTGTPVQALALRYAQPGLPFSPAVAWVGEVTLLQSLWSVASAQGLQALIEALPPQGSRHADRRALAAHVRDDIAQALNLPRDA